MGFSATSIVRLPTSGSLAAGIYSGAQGNADTWLGALDGAGRLLWMRRYGALATEGQLVFRSETHPTIQLTQDGGALLASYAESLTADRAGLWVFKAPAKDGQITFDAN